MLKNANKYQNFSILIIFLLLLTSCNSFSTPPTAISTATVLPSSTLQCRSQLSVQSPLPVYIDYVAPIDSIDLGEYNALRNELFMYNAIVVVIWADFVDSTIVSSQDSNYRREKIRERVKLYLDGTLIPRHSFIGDGLESGGPFYIHWAPNLSVGLYTAVIEIETDRDEMLTYSWQFCITEE
jgi:hypothetical protein